MERKLILRGAGAGLLAGLVAFVFARIFAEPYIGRAISYESARDAAQAALSGVPYVPEPEVFSRSVQANIGIGVGMAMFGLAMGGLFAVVYIVALGRVGGLRPRTLALLVAGAGFLTMYLVPFLKYPANPPSIGHADTIRQRTALYLAMVVCSVGFLAIAVLLGRRLQPRFGTWNATLLAGLGFAVAIGVVMSLLPSLGQLAVNRATYGNFATETPQPLVDSSGHVVFPGFPADVLFSFRLYSVLAQALLWGVLGLTFAPLADRVLGRTQPAGSGRSTQSEQMPAPAIR